jgi:hypothetical protein
VTPKTVECVVVRVIYLQRTRIYLRPELEDFFFTFTKTWNNTFKSNMRYNLNFMLLLLGASILGVSVAIEQRIDKRSARRQAAVAASMEISNLDFLRPYVCSPTNGRRQEYLETRTTTITIPLEDFADLWTQLSIILAQMAKIMMDASIAFPSPVGISAPTVVNSAGAAISVALPTTLDTIPPLASLTSDMDLAATTTPNQDLSFNTTLIGIPPSIVQVTNTEGMTSTSTTNIGPPLQSGESVAQDSQSDLASLSDTAPAVQLLVSILQTTVEDPAPANTSQPAEISPLTPTALGTTANISPTTPALLSSDPPYCEDEVTTSTTVYVTTTLTSIVIDTDTAQTGVGAISTANPPAPPGQALVETRPASSPSSFRSSPSSSPSTSGYTFNAQSSKNVVVYFGQTAATSSTTLLAQCADSNIDIVILAFIVQNTYQGSPYPLINFGAACGGQTSEMSASAPGLLSCPDLASMISECQKTYGKKVMLSIGGATGSIIFATEAEAEEFATVLWQLFGPPGQIDDGLRPFGDVEVDGFDIGSLLPAFLNPSITTRRP